MAIDVKNFIWSHIPSLLIIVALFVGGHLWLQEHDARVKAEITLKADEANVATLQTQINQNAATVAQLQQQIAERDKQNAISIANLLKAKATAVTPVQQVAVLQTEAKLPQPIVSIPDSPDWRLPGADVAPLFGAINSGLVAQSSLATCQDDLTDEKNVVATDDKTISDQTQQIALKDNEIAVLKKKPSFWHRVGTTFKEIGIGFGIGVAVAHKF